MEDTTNLRLSNFKAEVNDVLQAAIGKPFKTGDTCVHESSMFNLITSCVEAQTQVSLKYEDVLQQQQNTENILENLTLDIELQVKDILGIG